MFAIKISQFKYDTFISKFKSLLQYAWLIFSKSVYEHYFLASFKYLMMQVQNETRNFVCIFIIFIRKLKSPRQQRKKAHFSYSKLLFVSLFENSSKNIDFSQIIMSYVFHPEKKYPIQENVNYAYPSQNQPPPSYESSGRNAGFTFNAQYSDNSQQRQVGSFSLSFVFIWGYLSFIAFSIHNTMTSLCIFFRGHKSIISDEIKGAFIFF